MVRAGSGSNRFTALGGVPYLQSKELAAVPITRKGLNRAWYAPTLKIKSFLSLYMHL